MAGLMDKQQMLGTARSLVHALAKTTDFVGRRQLYKHIRSALQDDLFLAEKLPDNEHRLGFLLGVARIAHEELHLDTDSLLSLFLYIPYQAGCIEDKEVERQYGDEVLRLLRLTKRASALYSRKESISSENFHNLLLSMAEDIRVVLLIIADSLYRLR